MITCYECDDSPEWDKSHRMKEKKALDKLRIGKFVVSTNVNGPGRRFVIWFQGCPFRCQGCFNPEFWDENGGRLMDISEIITQIELSYNIEGVTFTGGEPFLQTKLILPLAEAIKSKDLTIVCYTGYLLQDILVGKVTYGKELLKWIDILIDGQYVEKEKAALLWRGSRNQKVYFLTNRYKHFEPLVIKEGTQEVEIQIGENTIVMTGILNMDIWERLKKEVKKK